MISRHWKGIAKPECADRYVGHLRNETFPELASLPGFVGATILRREVAAGTEFQIVTLWDSLSSIEAFAGVDVDAAVVPSTVQAMMVDYDRRAAHYVVETYSNAKPTTTAAEVVREFWRLMASNDFRAVGAVLAPEYVLEWPQSNERIRGAERFAAMNAEYPAHGPWRFSINHLVGSETEAVSDVSVTDGVQTGRAISFFTVANGKITRQVEFWPEPSAAAANRKHLVEPLE
jgi:heme-degrading monooxygenase HmoA/ketosteroid isomerase-like protein